MRICHLSEKLSKVHPTDQLLINLENVLNTKVLVLNSYSSHPHLFAKVLAASIHGMIPTSSHEIEASSVSKSSPLSVDHHLKEFANSGDNVTMVM